MTRLIPVLALFLLAPVCAEYLTGYDDTVGQPMELLGGLLIFAPLYGAPALLIRELARRTGRGWPAMLLLALAFGFVQAGMVDQSMFNPSYRDIDYWDAMTGPTLVPALGLSAYTTMAFTFGHMVWSIGMPIAVVEALVPKRRTTPWLGRFGFAVVCVLYVAASVVVLVYHLRTEDFAASPAQLVGTGAVVVALVGAALSLRRLRRGPRMDRQVPHPLFVGAASVAAAVGFQLLPPTWYGVAGGLAIAVTVCVLALCLSHRTGWTDLHRLALAGGALLANASIAFAAQPIGDVDLVRKLAHNVTIAAVAVALLTAAALVTRRYGRPAPINPDR